jgi:hypothetical protein
MALVEKYHVVAAVHPVGNTDITEGQVVTLNTSGEIIPFAGTGVILGVAGDTKSSSESGMPGIYAGWQNRASDMYNETAASRSMTVYSAGGEFATDQFESDVEAANPGTLLYGSANGKLQVASLGSAVAVLTLAAGAYPSGVPGTDINGDMALKGDNNNQYIEFKLLV